jgi:hypothetical protein
MVHLAILFTVYFQTLKRKIFITNTYDKNPIMFSKSLYHILIVSNNIFFEILFLGR